MLTQRTRRYGSCRSTPEAYRSRPSCKGEMPIVEIIRRKALTCPAHSGRLNCFQKSEESGILEVWIGHSLRLRSAQPLSVARALDCGSADFRVCREAKRVESIHG